jgi:hypothetical protein
MLLADAPRLPALFEPFFTKYVRHLRIALSGCAPDWTGIR